MVKDRGMSDHTRPYIPVLMETFIYDLGLGSLPNHTDHGKGLLLAVNMDANFSLVQSDW